MVSALVQHNILRFLVNLIRVQHTIMALYTRVFRNSLEYRAIQGLLINVGLMTMAIEQWLRLTALT